MSSEHDLSLCHIDLTSFTSHQSHKKTAHSRLSLSLSLSLSVCVCVCVCACMCMRMCTTKYLEHPTARVCGVNAAGSLWDARYSDIFLLHIGILVILQDDLATHA